MKSDQKYTLLELEKKLTKKENIFCHQYIIDWNAARASRIAGYKENRDRQTGYDIVTKSYIKQYIDFIKNDFEKEAGITKLKQLKELQKIAYSSISNLHNTWISLEEFEEIKENNPSLLDAIESIDTKIEEKTVNEGLVSVKYIKIKLHSKTNAIDQINKMMGYHEPEKINSDINIIVTRVKKPPIDER